MKKIGIIGSGDVGKALAKGFLKYGHEVMLSSREPSKLEEWKNQAGDKAKTGTFAEAAEFGELLVLAVLGGAIENAIEIAHPANFDGKTVIDATNPIDHDNPPKNGVIQFFTQQNGSLMERMQNLLPKANFVKAFNSIGSAFMVNPDFGGIKPTMFICGNNDAAKLEVKNILDKFGWESEDMGSAASAGPIEELCVLWCLPGMLRNEWSHAFKLLKK